MHASVDWKDIVIADQARRRVFSHRVTFKVAMDSCNSVNLFVGRQRVLKILFASILWILAWISVESWIISSDLRPDESRWIYVKGKSENPPTKSLTIRQRTWRCCGSFELRWIFISTKGCESFIWRKFYKRRVSRAKLHDTTNASGTGGDSVEIERVSLAVTCANWSVALF